MDIVDGKEKKMLGKTIIPVIMAPMFLVSSPESVIEACKAGIIGTFPLLNARSPEALENWFQTIREALDPAKLNTSEIISPWGVNLIVHKTNRQLDVHLEAIRKYEPPIVITSLGNPQAIVDIVHDYGGVVLSDVISTKHARKAAEAGVDGLILVCNGAGGHGGTLNPFAFVGEVKQFWQGLTIVAGCISNGRDIAAVQALGADFAYMGTRFIAAEETLADAEYKEMLLEATATEILYTGAISGVKGNYLIPSIVKAGLDPENLQQKRDFNSNFRENEPKAWKNIWGAGQGVGAITEIQSIASIVERLQEEYLQTVERLRHI
ncbi:nitronate monooxygenase [Saccharococcus sp. Marseille-Q5394]|uniref:NAD(P)H-dependent flavin oxidoreductase n=1 Tax=Saccharococcus sp. Marseille-Q5394 TaxID=2972778 RepID=UPI002916304E|nr:nitronate monooxygenase [Saccharococcus sp. Marseille-Q5394]